MEHRSEAPLKIGGDPMAELGRVTHPSSRDRELARAWAKVRELGDALREANEELAHERERRRELEQRLEAQEG